ncbi:hypothetical protein IAE19_16005 [Acinetobacter sp. S40]|uniref:zonular occludens toxin domain-containing protein n=1 Tax=Acinetobacter sp. S40 TaxID=2767434 RepID=UPI001909B555|nr:zonular occludens toxin domain-containing protein [Acinetobacter sp. S40]MBJ9986926.1 hypothetical protein [Acinetobacter sp. S40]MBJ9986934.1 hypothetical protein [Acinetobacter sp. S40]
MPVLLVTGKMGQGKTHLVMKKWVNEAVKAGRPVYTNIDGCTLDVRPIPENDKGELDWLLTEESNAETGQKGALIVYDEAQRQVDKRGIRYFAWAAREKVSTRDVIRELEYHRHSGRDIIFITQSPKLLHLHLLELVNEHYHCTRLRNEKRSQVSLWRSWQEKPDSLAATERAEDVFFVPFDDEVFTQYKSTEEVTDGKARIPKYMYKLAAIAIVCFIISIGLLINLFHHFSGGKRIGQDSIDKTVAAQKALEERSKKNTATQTTEQISPEIQTKIDNCMKQLNWTQEQCRDTYDKQFAAKRRSDLQQTTRNDMDSVVIDYSPSKPFKEVQVSYQATAKPVFSGCMTDRKGNIVAYTQQGTIIHDIDKKDCQRVMNGDRPFNYFAVSNQSINHSDQANVKMQQNSNL